MLCSKLCSSAPCLLNLSAMQRRFHTVAPGDERRGPLSLISSFVEKRANVYATNSDGWTPLHLAARGGKADRAQALLAGGAPVDARNIQVQVVSENR
jgi:ankyrin repeat protein